MSKQGRIDLIISLIKELLTEQIIKQVDLQATP